EPLGEFFDAPIGQQVGVSVSPSVYCRQRFMLFGYALDVARDLRLARFERTRLGRELVVTLLQAFQFFELRDGLGFRRFGRILPSLEL
ncbi:MAG TPA: hypothetical protein VN154_13200, partial [Rhizomicrobium sp.]|nr:hypothetical protein [Rhizomicrobium sp.]